MRISRKAGARGSDLLDLHVDRRRLGTSLVATGLSLIVLFAAVLLFTMKSAPGSCRQPSGGVARSHLEILDCAAQHAQARDRGLLLIPVAIAGGGLVAGGTGVLVAPVRGRKPERADDANWEAFAPRAELDLGPALYR